VTVSSTTDVDCPDGCDVEPAVVTCRGVLALEDRVEPWVEVWPQLTVAAHANVTAQPARIRVRAADPRERRPRGDALLIGGVDRVTAVPFPYGALCESSIGR